MKIGVVNRQPKDGEVPLLPGLHPQALSRNQNDHSPARA